MKQMLLTAITLYQLLFPVRGYCRYFPTCSQYAKIVIEKYGVMKGSWLAFLRILSCQPIEISNIKYQRENF